MSDKIKINRIEGEKVGNDLKGCYFLNAADGTYSFYDKNPNNPRNPILTGIRDGFDSEFRLEDYPDILWGINIYNISDSAANGFWSSGNTETPGSGTFQAQAGGTGEPEPEASSATA